jgi:hypothetical protein
MQELIFQKGINWNDYAPRLKRGGIIKKVEKVFVRRNPMAEVTHETKVISEGDTYKRNVWELDIETPTFTQDREFIKGLLKTKVEA